MDKKSIIDSLKNWNQIFCGGMVCRTNIARDIVVVFFAIVIAAVVIYRGTGIWNQPKAEEKTQFEQEIAAEIVAGDFTEELRPTQEEIAAEVQEILKTVDTSTWELYKNQYYGFELKRPSGWLAPKFKAGSVATTWEYRYEFRRANEGSNPYVGFDVVIYNGKKSKELCDTDEYPKPKSEDLKDESRCQNLEGCIMDTGDFSASEIYISPSDKCFQSGLFFSIVGNQYIYNLVPVENNSLKTSDDPRMRVNRDFPELYSIASTLELVEIVRPKPKPPAPKITARKPVSAKIVNGKYVCAKKNDKPKKSKKNKPGHLDLECCLDPDEKPNPWCTY